VGEKPAERFVEERHQTQHKLETMERYFGAWCTILARAERTSFCKSRLWIVDTHAGQGLHLSASDPDGVIPGTPLQALLAARSVERLYPGVEIRVRATDIDKEKADALWTLLRGVRGKPPVDVKVAPADWVKKVEAIRREIEEEGDHPNSSPYARDGHQHRSLWFIDPYGVEGIDHEVIEHLPDGAEVIVNLDLMGLLRDAGRAERGEAPLAAILTRAFGGDAWRGRGSGDAGRKAMAQAFTDSFPASKYRIRRWHLLRPSGSQDRALIHLSGHPTAADTFERHLTTALKAGTVLSKDALTHQARSNAAKRLHELFSGETLTVRDMHGTGATRLTMGQLHTVCGAADQLGYGRWSDPVMQWFAVRAPDPTLFS
jgi:three-Cys-motif partner protein